MDGTINPVLAGYIERGIGHAEGPGAVAEAERERRAKIIHADGEYQAAERLAEAGRIVGAEPATLQLRYLHTLTQVATERTSIVIFPLPLDIMAAFTNRSKGEGKGASS